MMKLYILFFLSFPSDSSYDAVRRTGWSNNMHSGKGETTIIIRLYVFAWKHCATEKGFACTGEFYYSVHIKTQKQQITLKHLLDVAFDLLKRPQKSCFWRCRCVPVSIYAKMRRMTEISSLRGRALSFCSNTARNGVIRCNLGAGRFNLMEIEVNMELPGLIHYLSS